jgi:hypothetical protein
MYESGVGNDIVCLRRAGLDDIGDLVDVHGKCFRDELFYQMLRPYAENWWSLLLAEKLSEVSIFTINGRIRCLAV